MFKGPSGRPITNAPCSPHPNVSHRVPYSILNSCVWIFSYHLFSFFILLHGPWYKRFQVSAWFPNQCTGQNLNQLTNINLLLIGCHALLHRRSNQNSSLIFGLVSTDSTSLFPPINHVERFLSARFFFLHEHFIALFAHITLAICLHRFIAIDTTFLQHKPNPLVVKGGSTSKKGRYADKPPSLIAVKNPITCLDLSSTAKTT